MDACNYIAGLHALSWNSTGCKIDWCIILYTLYVHTTLLPYKLTLRKMDDSLYVLAEALCHAANALLQDDVVV